MAKPRKRGNAWQVEVCINGERDSGTFDTKEEAELWAANRKMEARNKKQGKLPHRTLHQALDKYLAEIAPKREGARWEIVRCRKLKRELPDVALSELTQYTSTTLIEWRDKSLKRIKPASVRREMGVLRSVFEACRLEWKWLLVNPLADVKRPGNSPHRKRRVHDHEAKAIVKRLGFVEGRVAQNKSQIIAVAFLFAIETGMRKGEILGLTHDHLRGKFAFLPKTKNGDQRDVPLSPRARELLGMLPKSENGKVFNVGSGTADNLFREARDKEGIIDLHFHDSRHEAATRLAKKLDVLELARVLGQRDPRTLMIYYNPTAEELADRLAA